jgi:hypothetical protein
MIRRLAEEREGLKPLVEGRILAGKRQGKRDPIAHGSSHDRLKLTESRVVAGLSGNRGARI